MKTLITHLLRNNLTQIVQQSMLHCHVRGVHSIMLLNSPGQTIRLYYADTDSDLHRNAPDYIGGGMSVGFHTHHCNLTLHCVKGRFWNWTVRAVADHEDVGEVDLVMDGYRYQSQILTGTQGFVKEIENAHLKSERLSRIKQGSHITLAAHEIHTVFVKPWESATWLVYEGAEDPHYVPITYSNQDLTRANTTGMYQPMLPHQIIEICMQLGLVEDDFTL